MRLLVCSNSGPARPRDAGEPLQAAAAGGLLPQLLSLLEAGGEWVFPDTEPGGPGWPRQVQGVALHPVPVDERQRRRHYEVVSIETLLWLFHYLHDTVASPVFDARLHLAWATYEQVNGLVAERLARALAGGGDEAIVLVNDYHFLLVPGYLAQLGAATDARVVYSHQVPWCGPEYFGLLPGAIREQILSSLLSCQTVVFHSLRWLEAFARCCDRYLPAADVTDDVVRYRGRRTRLLAAPLPLDSARVLHVRQAEATQRWRRRLEELARGRQLMARVDRLDLWKNHLRGFAAYEALLRRRPRLADEAWFLAVVARTRYRSARHEAYEAACQEAVARINELAGGRGRPEAATLLYPDDPSETRQRGVAALEGASAVLVNPTYDGLNMVAKEAVLLSSTAAILLSRTAGAYEELAPVVAPLDPFDVSGTADALEAALAGGVRADAAEAARVRDQVRTEDARSWLRVVLDKGGAGA
jgi:trehalose 6-phosphate synthase